MRNTKSLAALTLLGLATYRLTKLVIEDEVTAPLRNKVWETFPMDTKIGYLFACPWCVSIWAGAGLLALEKVSPVLGEVSQKVLAASAVTGMLDTRF